MPDSFYEAFRTRFSEALTDVYAEPSRLTGTTEEAVVGRLLAYLHKKFASYAGCDFSNGFARPADQWKRENVPLVWDVEYMRAGLDEKALEVLQQLPMSVIHRRQRQAQQVRTTPRKIAPDLIWHRRLLSHDDVTLTEFPDANLVAVEVKMGASQSELRTDKAKLRLLCGLEPHIFRYKRDLRCNEDPAPGNQVLLNAVRLPQIRRQPYRLGISLNVFEDWAEALVWTPGVSDAAKWDPLADDVEEAPAGHPFA